MILIIMGVSGAGKTTVGKALADKLSYQFYDADDFHPQENKEKMTAGIALTDEVGQQAMAVFLVNKHFSYLPYIPCRESQYQDRIPWLIVLNRMIKRWSNIKENCVLACSALKKSYRLHLISGVVQNKNVCDKETLAGHNYSNGDLALSKETVFVVYVHLAGTIDFIIDRISKRAGHFMPAALLQSQFEDLEEPCPPENFISIDIRKSVSDLVDEVIEKIFRMDHYKGYNASWT